MKKIKFLFLFIASLMIFALASCKSEFVRLESEKSVKLEELVDDYNGFTDSVSYYSSCSKSMTINKTADGYYTYLINSNFEYIKYEYTRSQNKITKTKFQTTDTTDYKTGVTFSSIDEFAELLNNELTPKDTEKKLVSINQYYGALLSIFKTSKNIFYAPFFNDYIKIRAHFIGSDLDNKEFKDFFNSISTAYTIGDGGQYQVTILVDKDMSLLYPELSITCNGGTVYVFEYNTL